MMKIEHEKENDDFADDVYTMMIHTSGLPPEMIDCPDITDCAKKKHC